MPRIVTVPLSLEEREQLILLTKHAAHWRERQRAQTILWLSEGKTVAEVARLQERIPETIRLQRRHWELHRFESIQEGRRSGRPNTLTADYQVQILEWGSTQAHSMQNRSESNCMKNTVCPCLLKLCASFCEIQVWSSNAPATA